MKRLKGWQKNLIFAAVVLAAAALLFVLYRANAPKAEPLVAVVDFGDGITETIPLDEDHDYLYDVDDYIVHLQVKDGAIAFLDSQCPDHVCEQFGWLNEQDAWAACVPRRGLCNGAGRRNRIKQRGRRAESSPARRPYCIGENVILHISLRRYSCSRR